MAYGARWIKTALKAELSPLGEEVAEFLNVLADGIYHLDSTSLRKVNWSNPHWIEINIYNSGRFATYDFDWLTRIVLLSHDRCLRVEINASSPKTLKLSFHKRERDGKGVSMRMPTMEAHIEQLRKDLVDWEK